MSLVREAAYGSLPRLVDLMATGASLGRFTEGAVN